MPWQAKYGITLLWTGAEPVSCCVIKYVAHLLIRHLVVCLGYNTLHSIERLPDSHGNKDEFHGDLPDGKRLWTWLLLCDDKTVITINEDPFPFRSGPLTRKEQQSLGILRRNMINVFRQCSKARDPLANAALMRLPLRTRVGDNEEESQHRPSDVPGLLFYYIFDDWFTIYSSIARRDHRYAVELNDLVSGTEVHSRSNIVVVPVR
jgi:hypothetical protein